LQHQNCNFLIRQLNNEVRRETTQISIHLLIQAGSCDTVNLGEIRIEQDALAAHAQDPGDDISRLNITSFGHARMVKP
jgi:hypothetical protein